MYKFIEEAFIMKQMEIFEQAMCCPTSLCGPSIDPELLRLSAVLETLKGKGIVVGRYNLSNDPMKFVQTKAVTDFLQNHGPEELPLVLVDGAVQFSGRYPTNEEFADILGFDVALLNDAADACQDTSCADGGDSSACGCGDDTGSCCGDDTSSDTSSCCCGDGSSCC